MSELILTNISKKYKKNYAIKNINITISNGIYGLLGPNGAGKTTLMRVIATLFYPDSGNVTYGDISWSDMDKTRKIIGYLPQKFGFYKGVSVKDALVHIAIQKCAGHYSEDEVLSVIEKVNLTEETNKKIGALSGGMLRRVGIAQALIGSPKILIIDEPTAGLDPEEIIRFRNLIQGLSSDTIVIISTHIVDDVSQLCNKVGIIKRGELLFDGKVDEAIKSCYGKVWMCNVPYNNLQDINTKFEVISTIRKEDTVQVRFLSNEDISWATKVNPNLEESYLCILKGI